MRSPAGWRAAPPEASTAGGALAAGGVLAAGGHLLGWSPPQLGRTSSPLQVPAGLGAALAAWAGLWCAGSRRRPGQGAAARTARAAYQFKNPPPTKPFRRGKFVNTEIKNVEEGQRSFFFSQCPEESPRMPEVAVFGRSNVGKSSLINFITGRKLLSTVSKRPGHTKLIHHFAVDSSWYLVDLPGIGFAQAAFKKRQAMDKLVTAYIRHRGTLIEVLYLCDASLPPQDIDLHGIKWLTDAGVHLSIVFTKSDKERRHTDVSKGPAEEMAKALHDMDESPWRTGNKEMPQMFLTSANAKTGREDVLKHLADLRQRCSPRGGGASKGKAKAPSWREPPEGIR